MPDFAAVLRVKEREKVRLLAIPGVHAVGIGNKWVRGSVQQEPSILVMVAKKKPIDQVPPAELIPAEIDGISTDVHECGVPTLQADSIRHRPLTGGIQIEGALPLGEAGTLGCFAKTADAPPKIVAITNHHVVAAISNGTATGLTNTPTVVGTTATLAIAGTNTPGSLLVAGVSVQGPADPAPHNFEAFYTTDDGDDHIISATILAQVLTSKTSPALQAIANGGVISLNPAGGNTLVKFFGLAYGPHPTDPAATIRTTITQDPVTQTDTTISISGTAATDCFGSTKVNLGGESATTGFLVMIKRGDDAGAVAQALVDGFTKAAIAGLTVSINGSDVAVKGAQQIEFDIHSDRRVGQPRAGFCAPVSSCLDQSIGTVIDSRIQLDVALIQLDPGMQYVATIPDIGPITGTHDIQASETGTLHVFTRGRTTDHKSEGIVMGLNMDGHSDGGTPPVFLRHYTNGIAIQALAPSPHFSGLGDSGSAVVVIRNDPNPPNSELHEVAAILFSGDLNSNMSFATPIGDVLSTLHLTLETATSVTDVKTVPAAAVAPGVAPASHLAASMQRVQEQIMKEPGGSEVLNAVRCHASEALHLVNTNRRVAAVWQRNNGARILQNIISSRLRETPQAAPDEGLDEQLQRIQAVFERYGSLEFAGDLRRLGPRVLQLASLNRTPVEQRIEQR